jgi:Fic family protein
MKRRDLSAKAPGRLVKTIHDCWAFVPGALPPKITWADSLVAAIGAAHAALGHLSGLGADFSNPNRLIRMFLRREAEYSSRIEQTFAGVRTLVLFDYLPEIERTVPGAREVENNFTLLQFALDADRQRPITLSLLRQMHEILFQDVAHQPQVVGDFRKLQNWIGSSGDIREARYVPPPPLLVKDCLQDLIDFYRTESRLPPLVRTAIAHYQFEAIHPFDDGNGRIGRALVMSQLVTEGALKLPLINPSFELERNRRRYYDLLLEVTFDGKWEQWIEYFCTCVSTEAARSIETIQKLRQLRSRYHEQVRQARISGLLATLVDYLFGDPAISVKAAAKLLKITPQSAQRAIERLLELGIMHEVTGQQRNRVFIAEDIVKLFTRDHRND